MKYFIDTEFHEYKKRRLFSKGIDTIELISIGIISEDGREYYAISKDFNIEDAWSNEWLRKNVLKSIHSELIQKERYAREYHSELVEFSYQGMKNLIKWNGKSNEQIACEIEKFVYHETKDEIGINSGLNLVPKNVEFYGYYSDYDWVVFCWLFGRMIDLPKGFPKYCIDLRQMFEEWSDNLWFSKRRKFGLLDVSDGKGNYLKKHSAKDRLEKIKNHPEFPKQTNEHNALADARWNYALYKFLHH